MSSVSGMPDMVGSTVVESSDVTSAIGSSQVQPHNRPVQEQAMLNTATTLLHDRDPEEKIPWICSVIDE